MDYCIGGVELSILDNFDDKLNNILKIKKDYYEEACILMYVYIDYLVQFSNKKHNDSYHNRENFRHFIMNYSGKADLLRYIQMDRLINHFNESEEKRRKYGHYLEPYKGKLALIKDGAELEITNFFKIDDVEDIDKGFFLNYTIANRIYEFRNFAVHEYHNKVYKDLDSNEPLLIFVSNIEESQEGWYSMLYPFEFLYEILYNCYQKVREDYKDFVRDKYNGLFKDEI